jgi:predicted kinase
VNDIVIGDKSFVMLVGPTGCGKTTFRTSRLSSLSCVNPDSYIVGPWTGEKAGLAWEFAAVISDVLFKEGKSFVFDAQFVNEWTRRQWQVVARSHGYKPVGFIFDTPWEQIQVNQKQRGARGTYGEIPIPKQEAFYKSFRDQVNDKTLFEGFETYTVVEWGKEVSYSGT